MQQSFPHPNAEDQEHPRVETGGVRFGNDWPGYFMRGDNAMYIATTLKHFIAQAKIESSQMAIQSIILNTFADEIIEQVPIDKWKKQENQ